jgi:hypothetical protein
VRRSAASYQRDGSVYRSIRRALVAHHQLTPETDALVRTLRGRHGLTLAEGWALLGLAHPGRPRTPPVPPPVVTTTPAVPTEPDVTPDPWALPSPVYADAWLPGGVVSLTVEGLDRALDVGDGRHLHGLLSALVSEDHAQVPGWAVYPVWSEDTTETWAVCWRREAYARHAIKMFDTRVGAVPVTVRLGARHRLRAPPPYAPGVYRVRVTAITPVVIQSHGSARRVTQTAPRGDALARSLAGNLASALLGAELRHESIPVRVLDEETAPAITEVTRHYRSAPIGGDGRVRGWEGSITVETNAVGRWLLEVASRGWGLGGRVAMAFGRVRVEDLDATEPAEPRARSVHAIPLSSLSPRTQERLG